MCPRRLLALHRDLAVPHPAQVEAEHAVIGMLRYPTGTSVGIWPEVKFKYNELVAGLLMTFDYTFDYVASPIARTSFGQASEQLGLSATLTRSTLQRAGYTIERAGGTDFVEEWPIGTPSVIEIMTSSTSGGNKAVRSTIPMAFEDAMLGRNGKAPGINYRQVWARMVSQLIVKSEIAIAWGGSAIWVVQDALVDYICASTALNLRQFLSKTPSEVNMLAFSYGDGHSRPRGIIPLKSPTLFAGPITTNVRTGPSFEDMIHTPIKPGVQELYRRIAKRRPATTIHVS